MTIVTSDRLRSAIAQMTNAAATGPHANDYLRLPRRTLRELRDGYSTLLDAIDAGDHTGAYDMVDRLIGQRATDNPLSTTAAVN